MNGFQKTTNFQTALILGAMAAGAILTRLVPEPVPLAAYVPHTKPIPTSAVFKLKHASVTKPSHDAARDLTGIDVDLRRVAMLGCIS